MTKWQAKTINQREEFYCRIMAMCQGELYDVAEAAIEELRKAVAFVAAAVPAKPSKAKRAA